MDLFDEPPSLPKLPFIVGDLVLVAAAAVIGLTRESPLTAPYLFAVVACLAVGAILLVVPFLVDYARRQESTLAARQRVVNRQAEIAANAAEQASIATSGLHEMAKKFEALLASLERIQVAPSTSRDGDPTSLAKLDTALDSIHAAIRDLKRPAPAAAAVLPADMLALPGQIQELRSMLAEPKAQTSTSTPPPAVPPQAGSADETKAKAKRPPSRAPRVPEGDTPPLFPKGLLNTEITVNEPDLITPLLARGESASPLPTGVAPGKPKAKRDLKTIEEPSPPATANAATAPIEVTAALSGNTFGQVTRLTVTAYIGIGNKLFLRGDGPGLSPERGVPLQFVSIGKWRWETEAAHQPLSVTLWKNDEVRCDALGQIDLAPGITHEITATF